MGSYLKDPRASVDYAVDWGAGYLDGTSVGASDWSVAPDEAGGVAVAATAASATRTMATLEGGAPGRVYRVTNRVTLSDGRQEARTLTVRIEER